jgi:hypothetical protein
MENILTARANVMKMVGEKLQAQYGEAYIPNKEIKKEALTISEFKESSIMASDYCYNRVNMDPTSFKFPMYLMDESEKEGYKFVGLNYPYSGKIYWKPMGEPKRPVGEWINGKCNLNHDPRQK